MIPIVDRVLAAEPRLNARYHAALRLAELVLRATSVEHESGTVAVNGFLLDMPRLFEDFVTVALREALVPAYGGRVDDQDQNHFDEAGRCACGPTSCGRYAGQPSPSSTPSTRPKSQPDTRTPTCTSCWPTAPSSACAAATWSTPKATRSPLRHVVRRSGIEIFCHAVDLDQEPDVLISQMRDLAQTIASARLTALVSPTVFAEEAG